MVRKLTDRSRNRIVNDRAISNVLNRIKDTVSAYLNGRIHFIVTKENEEVKILEQR